MGEMVVGIYEIQMLYMHNIHNTHNLHILQGDPSFTI